MHYIQRLNNKTYHQQHTHTDTIDIHSHTNGQQTFTLAQTDNRHTHGQQIHTHGQQIHTHGQQIHTHVPWASNIADAMSPPCLAA